MTKNAAEVADWFKVTNELGGANFSSEVYLAIPVLSLRRARLD
tara:strand:- start:683 stop:811 length:129 start_codon:yes stop_codon:yes gene_type:complete